MKNKLNIGGMMLLMSFLFVACYEDLGNYDYSEPLTIEITNIEKDYQALAGIDSLHIAPKIAPAGKTYDCHWVVYSVLPGGKQDTISGMQELKYKVSIAPGEYKLVFSASERESGVTAYQTIPLIIETKLTTGWYFLKDNGGYTEYDLWGEYGKIENVLEVHNGNKFEGAPVAMWYEQLYNVPDSTKPYPKMVKALFTLSEKEAGVALLEDGKIFRNFKDLFYFVPSVCRPEAIFKAGTDLYFMNEGKMHSISVVSPNIGIFGEPKLNPHRMSPHKVAAYNGPLLFDELTSSFCTLDASGSNTIKIKDDMPGKELPPVNNLDSDLLFMGATRRKPGLYFEIYTYALLKNKNTDVYYLRKMSEPKNPYNNITLFCDTLSHDLEITQATHWATHLDHDIIYCAKDNRIWGCNVELGCLATLQSNAVLEGNVTFMRHLRYQPYQMEEKWFDHLVVATTLGETYRVYLFDMQGGVLQPEPKVYEGKGKVVQAMYISPMAYTKIY